MIFFFIYFLPQNTVEASHTLCYHLPKSLNSPKISHIAYVAQQYNMYRLNREKLKIFQ